MLIDLHVHTTYSSCSELTIEDILNNALTHGLDGVCITDHNSMAARKDIAEGIQDDGLVVIIGMEYDTPDGDFLLFGPFEDMKEGLMADELLKIVDQRGGVAVAAHPFRFERSVSQHIMQQGLCHAVESINGRNSDLENAKVGTWTRKYPLIQCGGSDAHTKDELGAVGTLIDAPVKTRDDLIHAIKSGLCTPSWNTSAPSSTSLERLPD